MTRLDGGAVPPPEAAAPVVCDGPRALMLEAREVPLGGVRGMSVHRSLPQRPLPMVGAWLTNYSTYPLAIAAPLAGFVGALGVLILAGKDRAVLSFIHSSLCLIGVIMTAGVSLFPFVMPSSLNPNHSLTIWDSASSHLTLAIMFWSAVIFVPLILFYTIWCYKQMWGKITVKFIRENDHSVY